MKDNSPHDATETEYEMMQRQKREILARSHPTPALDALIEVSFEDDGIVPNVARRELDALKAAAVLQRAPVPQNEDTLRWDALEREGHSLMYYGPKRWDAGWSVQPTPRDAIDAMRHDFCNAINPYPQSDGDGVVRCKRPTDHARDFHWGFDTPDHEITWQVSGAAPLREEADTERLNWILRNATVAMVEDGDEVGLFLTQRENDIALAMVADCSGEDMEEPLTAEDAPWLTDDQRADLNGSKPKARGYLNDPAVLRAAIDAARSEAGPNDR